MPISVHEIARGRRLDRPLTYEAQRIERLAKHTARPDFHPLREALVGRRDIVVLDAPYRRELF